MCVDAVMCNKLDCVNSQPTVSVRWDRDAEWSLASEPVQYTLLFAVGWIGIAAHSLEIKSLLVGGLKRRMRQSWLDMAVWWRSSIYVIAGHIAGLTLVRRPWKPKNLSERNKISRESNNSSSHDVAELATEEQQSWRTDQLRRQHMQKYLEFAETDLGRAENYLSGIVNPKEPLQLALVDEEAGELLDVPEPLGKLTRSIIKRSEGRARGIAWLREVAPVRKRGRGPVKSDEDL